MHWHSTWGPWPTRPEGCESPQWGIWLRISLCYIMQGGKKNLFFTILFVFIVNCVWEGALKGENIHELKFRLCDLGQVPHFSWNPVFQNLAPWRWRSLMPRIVRGSDDSSCCSLRACSDAQAPSKGLLWIISFHSCKIPSEKSLLGRQCIEKCFVTGKALWAYDIGNPALYGGKTDGSDLTLFLFYAFNS